MNLLTRGAIPAWSETPVRGTSSSQQAQAGAPSCSLGQRTAEVVPVGVLPPNGLGTDQRAAGVDQVRATLVHFPVDHKKLCGWLQRHDRGAIVFSDSTEDLDEI